MRWQRAANYFFWVVLVTLCVAFLFSVVAPAYQTPRQQESTLSTEEGKKASSSFRSRLFFLSTWRKYSHCWSFSRVLVLWVQVKSTEIITLMCVCLCALEQAQVCTIFLKTVL